MARQRLKIERDSQALTAISYLLRTQDFPRSEEFWGEVYSEIGFKERFRELTDNFEGGRVDPTGVNDWCEKYLDKSQWSKLKTALRMKRHRSTPANRHVQVTLTGTAYDLLKSLADKEGCTLSEVIEIKMSP